jgi:hypothetical protein
LFVEQAAASYTARDFAEAGGPMSYGANIVDAWRSVMALFLAHGVEGAPIGLRRLLRIEPKSRDVSFFHAGCSVAEAGRV